MDTMKPNYLRSPAALATPGQVQLCRMGQRFLGIDDETYYSVLMSRYGVEHTRELNQEQVADLLDDYKARGFEPTCKPGKIGKKRQKQSYPKRLPRGARSEKVVALATRDEIDKVNAVAALIQWRVENGLERFLAARMGIKDGKVRTSQDAYLAIEGLKKLFENHMKKSFGANWWTQRFDDSGIMMYIAEHKPAEWK